MGKKLAVWLLFLLSTQGLHAEENDIPDFNSDFRAFTDAPDAKVLLAVSTAAYPVTPGDVYQLVYMDSQGLRSLEMIVSGDYSVNLTLFGKINAENLTYTRLQKKIEEIIQHAYPGSGPQLILQSTGMFQVFLQGEVEKDDFVGCWGLSRLSDILQGKTTPYASFRNVAVISKDGTNREYDLFGAVRAGKVEQNPFLRPGDTVIVKKAGRRVTVHGEVRRPGTYQPLPGEGLRELIGFYADGYTGQAGPEAIRITRYNTQTGGGARTLYYNGSDISTTEVTIEDMDDVFVPARKEMLHVAYFEGALMLPEKGEADGASQAFPTGKYIHRFAPGERLSTAVSRIADRLVFSADLKSAYIIRESEEKPIPVNLEALLYTDSPDEDIELNPFDRIIIPFKQFFVTVSGAVFLPGRYPYVPDRDYRYYIEMAGGSDPAKNLNNTVRIADADNVKQPSDRVIRPEDRIFVEYNNPLYHINQWAVFISAAVSVTALVFSIVQISK
ncbi:MAG: SLBB domain-containing protein [Spirochaetales bacterium]|nr:SLBB domain-containing protein [Spirochaetales bacterium]